MDEHLAAIFDFAKKAKKQNMNRLVKCKLVQNALGG